MALLTGLINNTDILNAVDFLLMDALCKRPMTTREIAHSILQSTPTVLKRLRRYEELGMVVQRAKDKRWVSTIVLKAVPLKEAVSNPPGTNVYPARPELATSPPPLKVPNPSPPPPKPKMYVVPTPQQEVSPTASKISKQMRVPALLKGMGEVSLGSMGACGKCQKGTPMRYGGKPYCPMCARGGK